MSIITPNIPATIQPREKLLQFGVAALSDSELVTLFLRTGVAGKPAWKLAEELLLSFNGLAGLMTARYEQLLAHKGLGVSKACQLLAILEMSRRYLAHRASSLDYIQSPDQAREFLQASMRALRSEIFSCLYLDVRNRVISYRELFHGTLSGANVYPREVIKSVLDENAAAVIFAHNHPSGDPTPSRADIAVTCRLKKALAMIDVSVLDHIIVGDYVVSLAELGQI